MKLQRMFMCFSAGTILFIFSAFVQINNSHTEKTSLSFPYKKMGLTQKQAAAHLLSRFTFGATPGQIDEVAKMGLEKWFQQQLDGNLPDDAVAQRLSSYDALEMSNEKILQTYPRPGEIAKMAIKEGIISKDSVNTVANSPQYRQQLKEFMEKKGYKAPQELQRQLINQKVIRAAYGNNQLQEVLTDFWFNHFNVSLTKNQCAPFILTYERDAIRPNVLGNFEKLLETTAKHPAMLEYLDNASSVSNDNELARKQKNSFAGQRAEQKMDEIMKDPNANPIAKQVAAGKKTQGLNENYAREIMELHTLGVDGGYTQKDVTEVARALTGWTIWPELGYNKQLAQRAITFTTWDKMAQNGFVREGDFLFAANKHDQNEKNILGKKFAANGGYNEGMQVIEMLAMHPSTAKFICKKLAVRFVGDNPSAELINNLATVYLQNKGNIKAVITAIVNSNEFWSADALREKVKSPFEFAISAVRITNADVQQPFQLYNWCIKMGQKFYFYQAPTGFPDKATYWINTGSLLSRMNFGLAFATEKIAGIKVNLPALNNNHEPESTDAALMIYSNLLLPERNNEENIKRLTPLIRDNNVEQKINAVADKTTPMNATAINNDAGDEMMMNNGKPAKDKESLNKKNGRPINVAYAPGNNTMLAQVSGIIIGSPEFQRK